jgi:hypothetical protein
MQITDRSEAPTAIRRAGWRPGGGRPGGISQLDFCQSILALCWLSNEGSDTSAFGPLADDVR